MLLKDAPTGVKLKLVDEEDINKCGNLRDYSFEYLMRGYGGEDHRYASYNRSGVEVEWCVSCLDNVEVEIMGRFKAGDIVESPSGNFTRIAAVVEGRYVSTYVYGSPEQAMKAPLTVVSDDSLEGWKLYVEPEEVTLSMEDIADKFNIDVSKLRIKE